MEYWTILLQIIPIGIFVYFYYQRKFNYWHLKGVKGPEPSILKFGNLRDFSIKGQTNAEKDFMNKYGMVYGIYQLTTPILTVLDPKLIKQVLVKDFHIFVNRDKNLFDHEYFNANLFNSEDETWRRVRSITSPTFSTGKLRGMHEMMNRCVIKLEQYLDKVIDSKSGQLNVKEIFTGFTIDVIATTAFGTETNANGELNAQNIFVKHGTNLIDFATWRILAFFALPNKVNKWLGNSLGFDDRSFDFFVNLSKEIIKQRKGKDSKVKRNDLIQLLMDAFIYENDLKDNNYEKLTATADNDEPEVKESTAAAAAANGSVKRTLAENEIIAQSIIFFIAGFETTATTISMASYFMALNPEVQERLYNELTKELDGLDINSAEYFEKINSKIPYLDAVLKETLRKNPPVVRLQRRVGVKEYKLAGIPLEKDIEIQIPTYGVHHNAEFYPEPEVFNPDRFMPENKHLLVPYTYLPFGAGPRNCIGMRFAYQEIKLCLAKIFREFKFERCPETKVPMEFENLFLLSSKDIVLKVTKR